MPFFLAADRQIYAEQFLCLLKGFETSALRIGFSSNSDRQNLSPRGSLVFDAGELAGEGQGSALEESEQDW